MPPDLPSTVFLCLEEIEPLAFLRCGDEAADEVFIQLWSIGTVLRLRLWLGGDERVIIVVSRVVDEVIVGGSVCYGSCRK